MKEQTYIVQVDRLKKIESAIAETKAKQDLIFKQMEEIKELLTEKVSENQEWIYKVQAQKIHDVSERQVNYYLEWYRSEIKTKTGAKNKLLINRKDLEKAVSKESKKKMDKQVINSFKRQKKSRVA